MTPDDAPLPRPDRDRIRLDPDHITLDGVDLGQLDGAGAGGGGEPAPGDFSLDGLDDAEWGLSDEDLALGRYLQHRRRRRGRLFRVAAVIVVLSFLALELFTYMGRRESPDERQQAADAAAHSDFGPTSREMAAYLLPGTAAAVARAGFTPVPGNSDDASYDNRSLGELEVGGPSSATYDAQAGVVRTWTAADGRTLHVAIYLYQDRPAAASAHERYLTAATGAGGTTDASVGQFATVSVGSGWRADRAIGRFLVTVEVTAPAGVDVADADFASIVHAATDVADAVH